jgi:hypothetical protein
MLGSWAASERCAASKGALLAVVWRVNLDERAFNLFVAPDHRQFFAKLRLLKERDRRENCYFV